MTHSATSYRNLRRIVPIGLISLSISVAGCAVRDDVSFNPYAPNNGDPTALQVADQVVEAAEQAVRDFDMRLENAVY